MHTILLAHAIANVAGLDLSSAIALLQLLGVFSILKYITGLMFVDHIGMEYATSGIDHAWDYSYPLFDWHGGHISTFLVMLPAKEPRGVRLY